MKMAKQQKRDGIMIPFYYAGAPDCQGRVFLSRRAETEIRNTCGNMPTYDRTFKIPAPLPIFCVSDRYLHRAVTFTSYEFSLNSSGHGYYLLAPGAKAMTAFRRQFVPRRTKDDFARAQQP
jgi:hypothetical protein